MGKPKCIKAPKPLKISYCELQRQILEKLWVFVLDIMGGTICKYITVFILISVCSPTTEECDEDNMGSAGPSGRKHQAQCGQTSSQSVAEQYTQYQHRTY